MRVGIGYSELDTREKFAGENYNLTDSDWLLLLGFAVGDAVSGAAGLAALERSAGAADVLNSLKEQELKIHYSGLKIVNIDCSLMYAGPEPPIIPRPVKDALIKKLFLKNEQLSVKIAPGNFHAKTTEPGKFICMSVSLLEQKAG